MDLMNVPVGQEYIVADIAAGDPELEAFIFTLGCFSGEPITVVSRRRSSCTVAIKDSRYSIDPQLAKAITVA